MLRFGAEELRVADWNGPVFTNARALNLAATRRSIKALGFNPASGKQLRRSRHDRRL